MLNVYIFNSSYNRFRYSALKKDGQRLSVLLKKGHKVDAKPARPVTVYNLTLQEFQPPLFTLGSTRCLTQRLLSNLVLCPLWLNVSLSFVLQILSVVVGSTSEVWWMTWEKVRLPSTCFTFASTACR